MVLSRVQLEEIAAAVMDDFNYFFFGIPPGMEREDILPTPIDQLASEYLTERAGLNYPSIIMLEQITTIDKGRIKGYLGRLNEEEMWDVDRKVGVSLGLRDMAVRNTATGGLYHHEKNFRDKLSHRQGKREVHPGI